MKSAKSNIVLFSRPDRNSEVNDERKKFESDLMQVDVSTKHDKKRCVCRTHELTVDTVQYGSESVRSTARGYIKRPLYSGGIPKRLRKPKISTRTHLIWIGSDGMGEVRGRECSSV